MSISNFWELNAKNWANAIKKQAIASRAVTSQAIIDEILKLNPHSVLDMGCGEGWLAEALLAKNISYRGTDGSAGLVEIANKKHPGLFAHIPYESLQAKPFDLTYDVIVFNFALLDENIAGVLKTVKTFLEPHGHILIQTLNPQNLPQQKEGWNTEDFKTMTVPFEGTMPWYGRPLSSWKKLFLDCDLNIEKILEPVYQDKPASIIFILQ